MNRECDFVLIGTGLAPLLAARILLDEGKSVLVLNPDNDFFYEDSELPLDPLVTFSGKEKFATLKPERIKKNMPDHVLTELRPDFPGAVEFWPFVGDSGGGSGSGGGKTKGYHDVFAPFVRARTRTWYAWSGFNFENDFNSLEDFYLRMLDADLNPHISDGILALGNCPGISLSGNDVGQKSTDPFVLTNSNSDKEGLAAVSVQRLCDVDVVRFQNGMLEFISERLEGKGVHCGVSGLEFSSDGVRFHAAGSGHQVVSKNGVLVFWTPRMNRWVQTQAKKMDVDLPQPRGVRFWEEWSLLSRESLNYDNISCLRNMVFWADGEGDPKNKKIMNRLCVLRAGPLVPIDEWKAHVAGWASEDAFLDLWNLCCKFLNWDKVTIRLMRPRLLFEWGRVPYYLSLKDNGSKKKTFRYVVPSCDGPIVQVVSTVRKICQKCLG